MSKMSKKAQLDQENNNNVTEERDVEHFWGYGDKDMTKEDMSNIQILKRSIYWEKVNNPANSDVKANFSIMTIEKVFCLSNKNFHIF